MVQGRHGQMVWQQKKRRKREAQMLLTEAKGHDKHKMLTSQIRMMQEQMKRI